MYRLVQEFLSAVMRPINSSDTRWSLAVDVVILSNNYSPLLGAITLQTSKQSSVPFSTTCDRSVCILASRRT